MFSFFSISICIIIISLKSHSSMTARFRSGHGDRVPGAVLPRGVLQVLRVSRLAGHGVSGGRRQGEEQQAALPQLLQQRPRYKHYCFSPKLVYLLVIFLFVLLINILFYSNFNLFFFHSCQIFIHH